MISELLHSDVTGAILASFFRVYKALGYGFKETVYSRSLQVDLRRNGVPWSTEVTFDIDYLDENVGVYRCDLLVASKVIVEIKATPALTPGDSRQLLNYLRASGIQVGLLLHFGPRPNYKRMVLTVR